MIKPVNKLPDTNTIIRYLLNDDVRLSKTARIFFEKVKDGEEKIVLLESVIAECIYVLVKIYRVPRNEAAESLIKLLSYKGVINSDKKELIDALNLFSKKNLDIVDCILCEKSKSQKNAAFHFR
ncbi:MAG TPA: PIN domain-containing protein [Nitrospinota bacterium]|jgi:predicted nucleic-acid-binding protein|nr:PIN domain-containing protein [Nitrospinota bacterium]|tara:strand:+ start:545 stop:916 length:372 start_codon:yes stop_codon:yes gene_type:complete